jgi:hypothetical protein
MLTKGGDSCQRMKKGRMRQNCNNWIFCLTGEKGKGEVKYSRETEVYLKIMGGKVTDWIG